MELTTIDMDRTEARKAFLEYRNAVRERHTEEDAQIMRGYRELANGRQLISLTETIRAGGTVDKVVRLRGGDERTTVLPALAVCRADLEWVWLQMQSHNGDVVFLPSVGYQGRRDRFRIPDLRPEAKRLGNSDAEWRWSRSAWRAMVPNIPPGLRPTTHLRNFHILWEAEWALYTPPRPPGDPALLKRIGGDLFAVLAVWDLTPLEQLVLAGRNG
jgi:hypothetical protein